jgi:hypothetical protein
MIEKSLLRAEIDATRTELKAETQEIHQRQDRLDGIGKVEKRLGIN